MGKMLAVLSAAAVVAVFGVALANAAGEDPMSLVKQAKGDCLACHSVAKKVVGPAWNDVAAKYKNDKGAADALVEKVLKGGRGNWDKVTGGMAMTPHPAKPSRDDIRKIIESILAL